MKENSMKLAKTICTAAFKNDIELLLRNGACQKKIEEIIGLEVADLKDPDQRIPMKRYVQLEKAAPGLTNNPAIGLHLGSETTGSSQTGVVGHLTASCATIRESFQQAIRFSRLLTDAIRMELREEGEETSFVYMRDLPEYFTVQGIELALSRTIYLMKTLWGKSFQPIEVHFQYARPEYGEEYQKVFNRKPLFQQERNQIVFQTKLLDQNNPFAQPYLNKVIIQHAEELLKHLSGTKRLGEMVQKIILEKLPQGALSIDTVATDLHMSRQTLFRKLKKEEGLSFQDLLENTRKHLAKSYLKTQDFSINEVAFLTGFSESSAFHRAFKRWFGVNPTEYRPATNN